MTINVSIIEFMRVTWYGVFIKMKSINPPTDKGFLLWHIRQGGVILTRSRKLYFYEKLLLLNDIKLPNIVP